MYVVAHDSEDERLKITKRDDVSQEKGKKVEAPEAGKSETEGLQIENTEAGEFGTENLQIEKPEGGMLRITEAGEAKPDVGEPELQLVKSGFKIPKAKPKDMQVVKYRKRKDKPAFTLPPLVINST